ncbi:DUF1005 family protein (DUF1005) [Rhynchospora pubera]|uniref:DUF1005 family protein (DUF1005) n=1 Tax=Rhynchospora pubera TaxID=906938 RepID=A0AAV8DWB1_9POAL|nr:DUF1005 family protein (DUF1005) [Rhynchospora pubera]
MDPQAFVRLSVGSLGLRLSTRINSTCTCEIRLCGSAPHMVSVPQVSSSSELNPDHQNIGSGTEAVFYIEESKLSLPSSTGCFRPTTYAYLEIAIYTGRNRSGLVDCGSSNRKHLIGKVRLEVGPGLGAGGKPVLVHNRWFSIGGRKGRAGGDLHLRVKVEPDPRYIFRFEDATVLSPQVVQLHGKTMQPIFSCKFSCDPRRSELTFASQADGTNGYLWGPGETEQKHAVMQNSHDIRKGWKVVVHDLSGSAVAAAFMSTPFVPSSGLDRVSRSNPGAFLILRPDPAGLPGSSWHPWARLEAWRENINGSREAVCLRLQLLLDGHETGVVLSETCIGCDRGGDFVLDIDSTTGVSGGGYVMSCKVGGEGRRWQGQNIKLMPLVVQLAVRHVTCIEDAAVFVALAAAVDLCVKACRPFHRKPGNGLPVSSNDQ